MLQLVAEQYDSHLDGMEYGLFGPERIAQLEREDLDRYHRSILKTSSYCDSMDDGRRSKSHYELERWNLCLLADEIRYEANDDASMAQADLNNTMIQFRDETKSAMVEMKSELRVIISLLRGLNNEEEAAPILLTPPANPINELPVCNDFNSRSKTTAEDDDVGSESTIEDSVIEYDSQIIEIPDSIVTVSCANTVKHNINEESKQTAENDGVVLGKLADPTNACKVFDEMTEPFLVEEYLLGTKVMKTAHYMFDNRPTLSPHNSDESFYGKTDSLSPYPYIIETGSGVNESSWIYGLITNISKVSIQDLSYKDDVLGVSETNSPSLPKLGFNPQVFDPGTLPLFKQEAYENRLYCISSELLLHYSQVYGAFSAYNHLVTEFCCCLFEWEKSRINKIDWVLNTWNSWEVLLWICNVLLGRCKIPLVDFHAGALSQMCTAYDHAAPTLSNGYVIGGENANICFTGAVMPVRAHTDSSSKSLFEGKNFMFMSSFLYFRTWFLDSLKIEPRLVCRTGSRIHLLSFLNANFKRVDGALMFMLDTWIRSWHLTSCVSINSAVALWLAKVLFCFKPGSLYNDCDHSLHRDIQIHVFFGAKVMFVVKMISFRILFSDGWIDSLGLACNSGTWLCLLVLMGDHLAWDPGICTIFVYILEDKDVFKRVGKWIVLMEYRTELTVTMPKLIICREDHFGAITLQQARGAAYVFTQSSQLGALNIATCESKLFSPRLASEYAACLGKLQPPAPLKECYNVILVHYVGEIFAVLCNKYQGLEKPLMSPLHGLNTSTKNFLKPALFEVIVNLETNRTSLHSILTECCVLKSKLECGLIHITNGISSEAHVQVLINIHMGIKVYQSENIFLHHTYMYRGCWPCSYTCICIDGDNSAIFRNGYAAAPNDRTFVDGDMALHVLYSSDITCSLLVHGRFTQEQCLVYNVVFMPHGLGHLLGIDTHNPRGYLKDVLEWVGKDIILIDVILLIMSIWYSNSSHTHSLTNSSGTSYIEVSLAWLIGISGPVSFICVSISSMLLPLTLNVESLRAMTVIDGGIHWCLCDELDVHYSRLACSPYKLWSCATSVLEMFNTLNCYSFGHFDAAILKHMEQYGELFAETYLRNVDGMQLTSSARTTLFQSRNTTCQSGSSYFERNFCVDFHPP